MVYIIQGQPAVVGVLDRRTPEEGDRFCRLWVDEAFSFLHEEKGVPHKIQGGILRCFAPDMRSVEETNEMLNRSGKVRFQEIGPDELSVQFILS